MDDQEFINQLAEKLSKLGTVRRPLGFHYLHPYGTVPADSIICNGGMYSRALYKDFFDYITTQGWVKTEAEWQKIATRDNGFCPFYSSGDGSTNFRTPKFAPYQQIAIASRDVGKYHKEGLPDIQGSFNPTHIAADTVFSSGCFTTSEGDSSSWVGNSQFSSTTAVVTFEASGYNSVYGASTTVQPESHEWVVCVVAYGVATNVGSVDIQNVMSAVNAVQARLTEVEGKTTKFAVPAYGSGSKITANTTVTIQSNGFLKYFIGLNGTGGNEQYITINGTKLTITANNFSLDRGILPVRKGDIVNSSADECVFYPARYGV